MIYFRTKAYNAAATLPRAINSVLNQTGYGNEIIYYVCDNGSTDNGQTRKIVEEYAAKDRRIVPFYNAKNHEFAGNEKFINFPNELNDDDYLCFIDADDEYSLDFLEKLIPFSRKNQIDIVACPADIINAEDGRDLNMLSVPEKQLIIYSNEFGEYFPMYFRYFRDHWGKLFLGRSVNRYNFNYLLSRFGSSRIFSPVEALKYASRIAVFPSRLYKYYVYSNSTDRTVSAVNRVDSAEAYCRHVRDVLTHLAGFNYTNKKFLYGAYFRLIRNRVSVLLQDSGTVQALTPMDKLCQLSDLFEAEMTTEMIDFAPNGLDGVACDDIANFAKDISFWLATQDFAPCEEDRDLIKTILSKLQQLKGC